MSIDLDLSADQVQILESVRSVLHDKFPVARLRKRRNGEADRDALRDMAAQGWIGLGIDERLGGAGFSLVEDALLFRETGRRLVTPSLFASAMAARVAIACDQPDLAAGILDGSIRVCLANSIAYGLHGNSPDCFLYDAEDAQWALLITPSSLQLLGIDAFASIKRAQCADRSVSLRRAFLQRDNGRTVLSGDSMLLRRANLLISAQLLGLSEAALDLSVDYAKTRRQFGQPIGAFQAIKHKCASMKVNAQALEALVLLAALAEHESRKDAALQISSLRLLAGRYALESAANGIQIHGAMGFTAECDAHLFLLRAHLLENIGSTEVDRERDLLDLPSPEFA